MRRLTTCAALVAMMVAASGGSATTTTTTTAGSTTTTSGGATTTTSATTTSDPGSDASAITTNEDGSYTIDWDALEGTVFFAPPVGGSSDPFYHVHTDPAVDGFFLSIEAYTVYGTAWTGQLGDFAIGCGPAASGICVHFDPDGPGPIGNLGADFRVSGDITITQADENGFAAIITNLEFSDGTTIPGPFTVSS